MNVGRYAHTNVRAQYRIAERAFRQFRRPLANPHHRVRFRLALAFVQRFELSKEVSVAHMFSSCTDVLIPFIHEVRLMRVRIVIGILLFVGMAACAPKPVKVDNKEGIVSSVGPVLEDADGLWSLSFSVFDYEGDPVDVHAEVSDDGITWTSLEHCSDSEAPCLKQNLRGTSSRADSYDDQHTVVIDPGGWSLSQTLLRLYALEDRSDEVIWPAP